MSSEYQFLVDFTLPANLDEDFMDLIPYQRAMINRLFKDGVLLNYALSLESSRLWCIINATSELEVQTIISDLPLTEFMKYEVNMLTFYNSMQPVTPDFSMN